jgi:hypothetical protein
MSDETRLSDNDFSTILAWLMVSDPWPLSDGHRDRIVRMLNADAERRGFEDWTEAYHELHGRHNPRWEVADDE